MFAGKSYGVACVARAAGRADSTVLPGWVVERRLLLPAELWLLVPADEALAVEFEVVVILDIGQAALAPC